MYSLHLLSVKKVCNDSPKFLDTKLRDKKVENTSIHEFMNNFEVQKIIVSVFSTSVHPFLILRIPELPNIINEAQKTYILY